MKRLLLFLLPLALVPAWAGGFFDDFDGEDLGSHWRFGNPHGTMFYSVHDSLLEVYGFAGFSPQEWITANLPAFGDFDLRALVGWSDAPDRQAMSVVISEVPLPNPPVTAYMNFFRNRSGGENVNAISAGFHEGPTRTADAPPGGFHEFRLRRSGATLSAYLDGELFLTGEGSPNRVRYISLAFSGAEGRPAQMFVDRVSVVPEPTSVAALTYALGGMVLLRRRRER